MNGDNSVSLRSGRATWVERPRSAEHLRAIIEREWRNADALLQKCNVCREPFQHGQLLFRGALHTTHGLVLAKVCAPCHKRLSRYPLAAERFTRNALAVLAKARRGP
jgi:hypothetical protein